MSEARTAASDRSDPDRNGSGRGNARDPQLPPKSPKDKRRTHFWRATRFIYPYRRYVTISIVCAFFVGLAMSGGLTTMMPILKVLLSSQTVAQWADAQIVERRLGVKLADDADAVRVLDVKHGSPAAAAGIKPFDQIALADYDPGRLQTAADARATLNALADPGDGQTVQPQTVVLARLGGTVRAVVHPDPVRPHQAALRRAAAYVSPDPVWAIAEIFSIIATLAVVGNIVKFFQEYLSDKAAVLAVNDIRRKLYDHVLHLPMSHLGRRGTSDITSRLVQDSANLEQGFKTVLGQSIQEPIKAGMALGLALLISWKLTLVIVVFGPLMGAIIQKFGKKMRRASRAALQKSSHMLGQIEATLVGIRVVKAASAERFERRRYRGIMSKLIDEQLKMSRIDAFSAPTLETLTLLVVGAILLIATAMVMRWHTLSVTNFFLVMACLATIADSLRRLNKVNGVLQRSDAAAQRIFEVLDVAPERSRAGRATGDEGIRGQADATAAEKAVAANGRAAGDPKCAARPRQLVKLPPLGREVRFEHVSFAYPGAKQLALDDVDLTVPKGQCVAVVGRNGSGKTTLLALLPRFYDPDGGRVTVDGVDVRDATLRSLRGQVSLVTQDSILFPGTIAQNIAYGNPRATRDEVVDAARRAFAHEFILEKPLGYDTVLGGMGGQLSGGQKQRVCIARAILRRAPILILDEATSQVDAESEHLIQQAIESLMYEQAKAAGGSRPTTFVIAHRFSTILNADSIVVMDRGRIVGQGKHDELLRECETYQQLYERQLVAAPVG